MYVSGHFFLFSSLSSSSVSRTANAIIKSEIMTKSNNKSDNKDLNISDTDLMMDGQPLKDYLFERSATGRADIRRSDRGGRGEGWDGTDGRTERNNE